jgi:hypothetical protein
MTREQWEAMTPLGRQLTLGNQFHVVGRMQIICYSTLCWEDLPLDFRKELEAARCPCTSAAKP